MVSMHTYHSDRLVSPPSRLWDNLDIEYSFWLHKLHGMIFQFPTPLLAVGVSSLRLLVVLVITVDAWDFGRSAAVDRLCHLSNIVLLANPLLL